VVVWWLMAIWLKVVFFVCFFFFFFSKHVSKFSVHDLVLASFWGRCTSVCFGYNIVFFECVSILQISVCVPDRCG
jgi:hypothetical protein